MQTSCLHRDGHQGVRIEVGQNLAIQGGQLLLHLLDARRGRNRAGHMTVDPCLTLILGHLLYRWRRNFPLLASRGLVGRRRCSAPIRAVGVGQQTIAWGVLRQLCCARRRWRERLLDICFRLWGRG
ncbi:hypothetical protein D3C85_1370110 [compost metagenome]